MPLLDGDLESSEKPPSRKVRLPSSQLLPAHRRCRGGRTRSVQARDRLLLPVPLAAAEPSLSLQASPLSLPFPRGSSLAPGCPKADRGDAEELTLSSAPRVPEMLTGREEMENQGKAGHGARMSLPFADRSPSSRPRPLLPSPHPHPQPSSPSLPFVLFPSFPFLSFTYLLPSPTGPFFLLKVGGGPAARGVRVLGWVGWPWQERGGRGSLRWG